MRKITGLIFILLSLFALVQCAKRGSPSGGEKDLEGPELIKAFPSNLSVSFKGQKIKLLFDEYVQLKDVQSQLVVSPPLKYNPEIKPQNRASKVLEIILKDTLQENTTYSFNFGQSIVDFNEGNPNDYLSYVMSTGPFIDSLQMAGIVDDALNAEADRYVSVMLYRVDSTYNDSTVYKKQPNYITNTLDSLIVFKLKNLSAGKYAMVALKDENNNTLFDQSQEKIGFLDRFIEIPKDSFIGIKMFKEIPNYRAVKPKLEAANKITFGYSGLAKDIEIKAWTNIPDSVKTRILKERGKDSLNFWFTPYEVDSLNFFVKHIPTQKVDTFTVKTRKIKADSLVITAEKRGNVPFSKPYYLEVNTPIHKLNEAQIFITDKDTLSVPFTAFIDSLENKMGLRFEVKPAQRFRIQMFPGAIEDLFENKNDTISYELATKPLEAYGTLRLQLKTTSSSQMIVQLTDEKEVVLREQIGTPSTEFFFEHLEPLNYKLRVIYDGNKNGIWDTGNYLKRIQPEPVSYFPELLEVRANWEFEETFILPN